MSTELCGVMYERPAASVPPLLRCQYIAGHPGERHSWSTVKASDDHEAAAAAQRDHAPAFEKRLLEDIEAGHLDSILEALLNAGHNRKRTLRGLRGFPHLERRSSDRR